MLSLHINSFNNSGVLLYRINIFKFQKYHCQFSRLFFRFALCKLRGEIKTTTWEDHKAQKLSIFYLTFFHSSKIENYFCSFLIPKNKRKKKNELQNKNSYFDNLILCGYFGNEQFVLLCMKMSQKSCEHLNIKFHIKILMMRSITKHYKLNKKL